MIQTTTIFANVSKGILSKHEDMQLVFGTTNQDIVCRIILADGEMQVCHPPKSNICLLIRTEVPAEVAIGECQLRLLPR